MPLLLSLPFLNMISYLHAMKKICYTLAICCLLFALEACRTNASEPAFDVTTDEFILSSDYVIQAIAAEPLLDAPMAISFDPKGRIWAVELPGYMRDLDGSDELEPDGRIVVLTDTNQDGVMDKRKVVMDGLVAPRTLLHTYNGLLYSNGTSLYWADLDGTSVKSSVLVDSLYVVGGNIEHQPNNLFYNIDNWIYSANLRARYRYQNGEWLREATSFRGQWGISSDLDGRLYYNNNSLAIATDYSMPNQFIQNPYQQLKYSYSQSIATNNRIYAYQATAVNRGYSEGVLDEAEKIKNYTSACSPLIYTGDLLGEDFYNNAFVCAPEANLIKRYRIEENAGEKVAKAVYENTEFLVSKEETFRPINLYNAPDGSLYILDLRKGIIQHRAYMTSYLREKIIERGLDTIQNGGRIYRVATKANETIQMPALAGRSQSDLVKLLASEAAYERKFAQQQLVFQQATDAKVAIEAIVLQSDNPYAQLHALWTLEGLGVLDKDFWQKVSAKATAPVVHETLIRFSAFFPEQEAEQLAYFEKIRALNKPQINGQLAVRLGQMQSLKAKALLLNLAQQYGNNPILCEAIISGIAGKEAAFLSEIQPLEGVDSLQNFLQVVLANKAAAELKAPQLPTAFFKDDRTAGFDLYSVHCAACHAWDGKGKDNLAPPLLNSDYVAGSKERLILLTLHGLKGPVTVNGKRYEMNAMMPGIKNNPDLSDKDIADILTFLRNSFSLVGFSGMKVTEEEVAALRESTKDREDLFTEEELNALLELN